MAWPGALHSFMHIVEFNMFLSSSVWILLTCGTIFGSVDFGAGFEDEEEAEPEDVALPGFRVKVEALLFGLKLYLCFVIFYYICFKQLCIKLRKILVLSY
ncbi:hypothetical protein I3760_08G142300 [Carya illinoinensis]|nr:hypothetical protein I3760_08G142300 [Carya illinoinensis]